MTREISGGLAAGDEAPAFELAADGGGAVSLKAFAGRKLALYFYPKDDTSGCTREAIDFDRLRPDFEAADTAVLGVSPDTTAAHVKFKTKHGLGLMLASDPGKDMLAAYGVWVEKSMYGRAYMGVERTTVLIGRDGRIARIWRKVKVAGHAEAVLAEARALP